MDPTEFKITPGTAYIPDLTSKKYINYHQSGFSSENGCTHPVICPMFSMKAAKGVTSFPRGSPY